MAIRLSEDEIEELTAEEKPLPENYRNRFKLIPKKGHGERQLDIEGNNGNKFRIILRQNSINENDYSVILAYLPKGTNIVFRLRR